jgi:hypothetical protein
MKRAILIAVAAASIAGSAAAEVGFGVELGFGPPPRVGDFWYGAPPSLAARIQFLGARIRRMHDNGLLTPAQWEADSLELRQIDALRVTLLARDGGQWLPADHQVVWNRLDSLRQRLNWQASLGY